MGVRSKFQERKKNLFLHKVRPWLILVIWFVFMLNASTAFARIAHTFNGEIDFVLFNELPDRLCIVIFTCVYAYDFHITVRILSRHGSQRQSILLAYWAIGGNEDNNGRLVFAKLRQLQCITFQVLDR